MGSWPAPAAASTWTSTPALAAGRDDLRDGLTRADLMVPPLDVHERGVITHGGEQLVGIDPTVPVDTDDGHLGVGLGGQADGGVLDGRQHLVPTPLGRSPARG